MKERTEGFSLPELLVSLTLFCLLGAVVFTPMILLLNLYHFSSAQLTVNAKARRLTNTFEKEVICASSFTILKDYSTRYTLNDSGEKVIASKSDGESGNCLLLVFTDSSDSSKVERLIGYYWQANSSNAYGTLYRFEKCFSPSSSLGLWDLMPAVSDLCLHEQIIHDVSYSSYGADATASTGMFYNYYSRSILFQALIRQAGDQHKDATVTYKFTASPRG